MAYVFDDDIDIYNDERVLGIPGDSVMLRFRRRMKILRARLSGGR
jgi:hypothetical protein